jgi:hypothetical protein
VTAGRRNVYAKTFPAAISSESTCNLASLLIYFSVYSTEQFNNYIVYRLFGLLRVADERVPRTDSGAQCKCAYTHPLVVISLAQQHLKQQFSATPAKTKKTFISSWDYSKALPRCCCRRYCCCSFSFSLSHTLLFSRSCV